MYLRWYAENTMWTFVPVQQYIKQFFETFADYPYQTGSSLTASNLGYQTLRQGDLMKKLEGAGITPGQRQ
jgi:arylsulfatase